MKKMDNKGFSLIELIIVIAIMAVLVAVIAPNLTGYIGKSKANTDKSNADTMTNIITNALQDFVTDADMCLKDDAETDVAGTANTYLTGTKDMSAFIGDCANADEKTALKSIYKSLQTYVVSGASGASIDPKVTSNKFTITFNGTYDEGFTCEVKSVSK
jgi:prepilin-type N-terminal cleavage/methylation domain-containing protein